MSTQVYAAGTIFVSSTRPDQNIEVLIQSFDMPAFWSIGDSNEFNSTGITLLANHGNVKAQRFGVTPGKILLVTPDNSTFTPNAAYVISTYVVSEPGVTFIELFCRSDPDVIVKFAFAGQAPIQLSQGPILISWP